MSISLPAFLYSSKKETYIFFVFNLLSKIVKQSINKNIDTLNSFKNLNLKSKQYKEDYVYYRKGNCQFFTGNIIKKSKNKLYCVKYCKARTMLKRMYCYHTKIKLNNNN